MRERCYTVGVEGAKLDSVAEVHPWRVWKGCGRWQKHALDFHNGVQVLLSFEVGGAFEGGHEVLERFGDSISRGDRGLCDVFVLEYTVSNRQWEQVALTKM